MGFCISAVNNAVDMIVLLFCGIAEINKSDWEILSTNCCVIMCV